MTAPALRADAERNRRLLVEAARTVFAERGLNAPLDEIARRARVGNATLYRRFPTRCQLVAAVFADTLREVVDATQRALAHPDPWPAFTDHVTFLCQVQASNRALADLLIATVPGTEELQDLRRRAYEGFVTLVHRAKASGDLRDDFHPEDVVLVLMANAGLLERTGAAAPTAWRRHLSYLLDGLHAPAGTPAPPSPGEQQIIQAMDALAQRHGFA